MFFSCVLLEVIIVGGKLSKLVILYFVMKLSCISANLNFLVFHTWKFIFIFFYPGVKYNTKNFCDRKHFQHYIWYFIWNIEQFIYFFFTKNPVDIFRAV